MPAANPVAAATDRIATRFIGAVEDEWQLYSDRSSDYTIGAPIGYGASSIVYAATFKPAPSAPPTPCALKVVDLDRLPPHALHLLMQETRLMSLSKHPNVLRVRGTWMDGHKLFIALRLMNAGSAADVMRYAWTGGMEEEVVKCILKQALEGLNYLHINGLIHRDVKAANLLIDDDGTVLLGDLGVAAALWDSDDVPTHPNKKSSIIIGARHPNTPHQHVYTLGQNPHHNTLPHKTRALGKRKSFVGTPCWMAPEVITGKHYDASADIWSFGITALELTQGRAPLSRSSPSSVLSHIASSPAPKMDRNAGVHTYSAAFADIISQCLQKDPSKRPTAAELLNTNFFKGARKKGYLVGTVLKGLPPLTQRQERKQLPSVTTHATMESWDFSVRGEDMFASPTSPTTSVYSHHSHARRPRSRFSKEIVGESSGTAKTSGLTAEEEADDAAAYARRIRAMHRSGSRTHSRAVSWASDEGGPSGASTQNSIQGHPDPIAEVEPLSISPKSSDGIAPPGPAPIAHRPARSVENLQADNAPSTSPPRSESGLSCSSQSFSTSTDPSEPVTPPSSVAPPSTGLWRKIVGRGEPKGDRFERGEKELPNDSLRRRAFNGVGALAGKAPRLVRTVSRVGTGKQ